MDKYIDLSYTIEDKIKVHPYDEPLKLKQNKFLDKDKYNDSKLETGMHVGTHIDAPSHLLKSNKLISNYLVDRFFGDGCLLDVRDQRIISMKEEYKTKVQENSIVLLYTNYSMDDESYYTDHPVVDKSLANFLISKNIKMIGMDIPSLDEFPFEIHKMLLKNDILIIENLRNLTSLLKIDDFEIIALPLKIKANGSLARVVAKVK